MTNESPDNAETADVILAWYAGDDEAVALEGLLATDVVAVDWMSPGERFIGREAFVEQMMNASATAFPDAAEEMLATVFDGCALMIHAIFRAPFAGDYFGGKAHGGIRDGVITEVYFGANSSAAWEQIRSVGARELGDA